MRYPDGGGLSAAGRASREKVRLQAAEWFAEGVTPPEVARRLRVSCNSAYAWRRRWRAAWLRWPPEARRGGVPAERGAAGAAAGRAAGRPGGVGLERGSAVDAGPGRRADRPAVSCPLHAAGHVVAAHRMGFSPRVPVHRAAERDEDAIAAWRAVTWAKVRG